MNRRQAEVLSWIRNGCPTGVFEDGFQHRIVARALAHRGLVTVTGRGASWTAKLTDAGRAATPPAASGNGAMPPAGESEADQLIARVVEAGGRLLLPDDPEVEEAHERLVRESMTSPRRPKGKRLRLRGVSRWDSDQLEVVLVEHFDDYVEATPVPVPAGEATRAARIVRAIMAEAPRRGLEARAGKGKLALRTPAGTYELRLREAPGKLEFVVRGPGADGIRYGDTKSGTVEEKLPELFRFLEIHRLRAEWHDRERRRRVDEKRQTWAEAMAAARTRFAEHTRWEHFTRCSNEWHAITQHRAFLAAARQAADSYRGADRDELITLLADAERMLDELDPLRHPNLLVPAVPDPAPDDLAPFLDGWIPYGPG